MNPLIIQTRQCWKVSLSENMEDLKILELATDAEPSEVAQAIAQALRERVALSSDAVLALAGESVLAIGMRSPQGRSGRRQILAYQLEELLPLSAEEMVSDYIEGRQDVFAVAAELNDLQPLVKAFTQEGIRLRCISPLALLALQSLDDQQRAGTRLIVWGTDASQLHLFLVKTGKLISWRLLSNDAETMVREISLVRQAMPDVSGLVAINLPAPALEAATQSQLPVLEIIDLKMEIAAQHSAARIVEGRENAWIELRRAPLGSFDPADALRFPLRLFAVCCLMFCICLAVAMWLRGREYDTLATQLQHQQEEVFQELFPGQHPPVGVRSRLESEHRKLAGVTGNLQGMPELRSAMPTLAKLLASLPTDLRFRILEIRLDAGNIYLEGEIRQHGDADIIAGHFRDGGLEVEPPRTERLGEKGVAYVINAKLAPSTTSAP